MKKNELQLMSEILLKICIDGRQAGGVSCTPQDVEELAAGWLLTEGYINTREEIGSIDFVPEKESIFISLSDKEEGSKNVATASCRTEKVRWSDDDLKQIAIAFKEDPPMRRLTGASHSCMIVRHADYDAADYSGYDAGGESGGEPGGGMKTGGQGSAAPTVEVLWRSEDASRHSAFDKAVGWAVLSEVDTGECLLMMSGRMSTRMTVKAARAGVGALAGKGTVTKEAVEIAKDNGMALIGYVYADGAVRFNE